MNEIQELEKIAQQLIGSYGWMAFGAFAMFFFKDLIQSIAEGVSLMMGNDINQDDVIYISGRKARVVRVGLRKTIFYMRDRGTKMIIPNTQLKKLTLEKKLMHNGHHPEENGSYLKKSTENGKGQEGLHAIEKEFSVKNKK